MNNGYFTPQFNNVPPMNQGVATEVINEQSYIENILRLNKGKKVKIFMTIPDSIDWRDQTFSGIIEESGRDHIILSDPSTGKWYLLLMIYIDYVVFDEPVNYLPQFTPKI